MPLATLAALAGALIAAGPTAPVVPVSPAAREAFDRGQMAFGRAEYQRAIEILYPLLYPDILLDSEGEIVQARRMLAVAYLFENKPEAARREYKRLLELRRDYRFDPLLDSHRVVDFFDAVFKEQEAELIKWKQRRLELDKQRAEQRKRDLASANVNLKPTIVRYERHSFAVNFIPFGAGQFQNGQRRKGWAFLGAEATLGAISLGAFATNLALYGLNPHRGCKIPQPPGIECPPAQIDHSQEDTSRVLLNIQVISGGLFFAVAIWGVIDAIQNHQLDVLLPDNGSKVAHSRSSGARLTFSPSGLGAAWTF
jgi:hypothetical protein